MTSKFIWHFNPITINYLSGWDIFITFLEAWKVCFSKKCLLWSSKTFQRVLILTKKSVFLAVLKCLKLHRGWDRHQC